MLDAIRKNASSWGVKILFGLIIVIFAFWGIGSFSDSKTAVLANINGEPLLLKDFNKTYEQKLKLLYAQEPDLTPEDLERAQFKQAVLRDIINQQLLLGEANRLGITVGQTEIQETVLGIEAFRNEGDRFDPDLYRRLLQGQGMTPAMFEADVARSILLAKLRAAVDAGTGITTGEAYDIFRFAAERAIIEYVQFPWVEYVGDFEPTEEAIQQYYTDNTDRFQNPPQIKISTLQFTPAAMASGEQVSDEEIADYYAQNAEQEFTEPERIHARHILIKVEEGASEEQQFVAKQRIDEVYDRILAGEDFATLAMEFSEGPTSVSGGDLGWFGRGQMVGAFEDAAFALKPGEVSGPVRTNFGFHLIKLEERQEARQKSLDEVKEEIHGLIAEEKAAAHITDTVDLALEQVVAGVSLEDVAKSLNMTLTQDEPFSRQDAPRVLGMEDEALNILFAAAAGSTIDRPLPVQDGYLIARVDEAIPAAAKPLEEVHDQIVSALRRDEGMNKAQAAAQALWDQVAGENANPLAALPTDFVQSEAFGRQGYIPGLGTNPTLSAAAFDTDLGKWLPEVYEIQSGYIVARSKERVPPEDEVWAQQQQRWMQSIQENLTGEVFSAFMQSLYDKAEVEILNPDYLN